MPFELQSAVIGLVGALVGAWIGGFMAVQAAVKSVDRVFDRIEQSELRRMKVECVVNLTGARHVLGNAEAESADRARFNMELNKIPVLFADDSSVMSSYRYFADRSTDIERIAQLVEVLTKSVKIVGVVEKQEFQRVLRA